MNRYTIAIVLVVLAVLPMSGATTVLDDQWVTTTLIRLIADPVTFHKKNVFTRGFLYHDGDGWYLCYSSEAWKLDPGEGGILLYHPNGGLFVPQDARLACGTPVAVSGRLEIAGGIPARNGQALRLYLVLSAEYAVRPLCSEGRSEDVRGSAGTAKGSAGTAKE
jgi:hypothetical protein